MGTIKAIFIPGNGGGGPQDNWFPYLARELSRMGIQVIAEKFSRQYSCTVKFLAASYNQAWCRRSHYFDRAFIRRYCGHEICRDAQNFWFYFSGSLSY